MRYERIETGDLATVYENDPGGRRPARQPAGALLTCSLTLAPSVDPVSRAFSTRHDPLCYFSVLHIPPPLDFGRPESPSPWESWLASQGDSEPHPEASKIAHSIGNLDRRMQAMSISHVQQHHLGVSWLLDAAQILDTRFADAMLALCALLVVCSTASGALDTVCSHIFISGN